MKRLITLFIFFGIMLANQVTGQYQSSATLTIPSFTNHSKNPEYDWMNEAIADMLTTDIASTKKIRVVNRLELKKILDEQKFIHSDFSSDQDKIKLGNMVGASLILTGSYTIIQDQIRVDAQIFDVSKGISEGGATAEGSLSDLFVIQKKLTVNVLETLSVQLEFEEKLKLFQVDSENLQAVENNYKGIIALDNNEKDKAKQYFEQAVQSDPFYKNAQTNLNSVVQVKGDALFSDAMSELDHKNRQKDELKSILDRFVASYYIVQIAGTPEIKTKADNPNLVDIAVSMNIDINKNAIMKLLQELKSISNGNSRFFLSQPRNKFDLSEANVFEENLIWALEKYGSYYGQWGVHRVFTYTHSKMINLKSKRETTESRKITLSRSDALRGNVDGKIDDPWIDWESTDKNGSDYQSGFIDKIPAVESVVFKNIDISTVKSIETVEIVDP